jgi:hypothetical protein
LAKGGFEMTKSRAERIALISRHVCDGVSVHQICCEHDLAPADLYHWWGELSRSERERIADAAANVVRNEPDLACGIVAAYLASCVQLRDERRGLSLIRRATPAGRS